MSITRLFSGPYFSPFQLNSTFSPHNGIEQNELTVFCVSHCRRLERALWREQEEPRQVFQPSKNWQAAQETLLPDDRLADKSYRKQFPTAAKSLLAHAQQSSSQLKSLSSFTLQYEILFFTLCLHIYMLPSTLCIKDKALLQNGDI